MPERWLRCMSTSQGPRVISQRRNGETRGVKVCGLHQLSANSHACVTGEVPSRSIRILASAWAGVSSGKSGGRKVPPVKAAEPSSSLVFTCLAILPAIGTTRVSEASQRSIHLTIGAAKSFSVSPCLWLPMP